MKAGPSIHPPREVLLVEDSPGDVRLVHEAFREAASTAHLCVATDGIEAMSFLNHGDGYRDAPRPDLILLDLNLPRVDGREILARIKSDDALQPIPVLVLTTSAAPADIVRCYRLGANCYLSKPPQLEAFDALIRLIDDFWLTTAQLPLPLEGRST